MPLIDLLVIVFGVGPTDHLVNIGLNAGNVVHDAGTVLIPLESIVIDVVDRRLLFCKPGIGEVGQDQGKKENDDRGDHYFLGQLQVHEERFHFLHLSAWRAVAERGNAASAVPLSP